MQWKWLQRVALSRDLHFVYFFFFLGVVSLAFVLFDALRSENFMRIMKFFFLRGKCWMKIIWMNEKKLCVFAWNEIHPSLHLTDNGIYLCVYLTLRCSLRSSHGLQFAFNLYAFSCDDCDDDDRWDSLNEYIALRPLERHSQYSTQSHFHF